MAWDNQEDQRLLLVDDEPAYHDIVRAILGRSGIGFVGVRDAPAAFQALRGDQFSLILMDIQMSGINGFRGMAHIRTSAEWTKTVPIIAFTALRPPEGERHFLERGFDGWLPKPFTAQDFEMVLVRWLRSEIQI